MVDIKKSLYEILVPTKFEDTQKPVSTRHHRKWDEYVRPFSGGLTILKPARGQWISKGQLYEDRMIPVRLLLDATDLKLILKFTKKHYRQIAILAYKISDEVIFYE